MKGISSKDKSLWAIHAAEKIEEIGERENDIWEFMRSMNNFMEKQVANSTETDKTDNSMDQL